MKRIVQPATVILCSIMLALGSWCSYQAWGRASRPELDAEPAPRRPRTELPPVINHGLTFCEYDATDMTRQDVVDLFGPPIRVWHGAEVPGYPFPPPPGSTLLPQEIAMGVGRVPLGATTQWIIDIGKPDDLRAMTVFLDAHDRPVRIIAYWSSF